MAILPSSGKSEIIFLKGRANTVTPSLKYLAEVLSIQVALLIFGLNKIFLAAFLDLCDNLKSLDTMRESGVTLFMLLVRLL